MQRSPIACRGRSKRGDRRSVAADREPASIARAIDRRRRRRSTTSSPIEVKEPTATFAPSFADFAIEASGETPTGFGRSANHGRRPGHREIGILDADPARVVAGEVVATRIAPARGRGDCGAYFGLARKSAVRSGRLGEGGHAGDRAARAGRHNVPSTKSTIRRWGPRHGGAHSNAPESEKPRRGGRPRPLAICDV